MRWRTSRHPICHLRMFTGDQTSIGYGPASGNPGNLRLRLFNVKYSPNLGDGLLSECLEGALRDCGASEASSIDLAGRTAYNAGSAARGRLVRFLQALPAPLRRQVVRIPLRRAAATKWVPHYLHETATCDAIIIGGGNLISDLDLNFPTKLSLAIDIAAQRGTPVYIYGVGVSDGWSKRGKALLYAALAKGVVQQVTARDERSRVIWDNLAGERFSLPARVVRDPGLLAVQRYAPPPRPQRSPGTPGIIGLNIMSALAVTYHGGDAIAQDTLDSWYLDLARNLVSRGWRLAIFSNGSPEDREMVERLRPRFLALDVPDTASPAPIEFPDVATPQDLVASIAALDGLIAFRMHAIIAAYSCAVPFLALAWDRKLTSFVESVDCSDWYGDIKQIPPETGAERIIAAIAQGIPDNRRDAVVNEAREDVRRLYRSILAPSKGMNRQG